ncbi:MAG: selenocysteine-specific translation elongation factor [Reyranella sp.]|uniref:selenocysteine-specific translation elongation factor n=1 Tax=Reyranella sp. TaxID=1929291 RepID=UPI001ACD8E2B|nr:selenocysteine-specific translation elongation factor [Reyranella sp.]MBN9088271.1 selenocysteine-specific translation elongation factor [Reyranella sp.]
MIVGTAGHIDHGKTALVKALTGVDADRLKEEKARGITIDLGYAYSDLGDGRQLGFVDVPGHERFVHNMLAGATGIDAALLVVSAAEGIKPQTVEHLQIMDLLGLDRGIVALTKSDLVNDDELLERMAEVETLLSATSLKGAEIVPVSAITGQGVDELKAKLLALGESGKGTTGHARLAVDRCFLLSGAGVVVTGTVHAGEIKVGDHLLLTPSGLEARVRSLHAQNRAAEVGHAGERCALNLSGAKLSKEAVKRGDWVVSPALHAPTDRVDVQLKLLTSEPQPLKHWSPVHVHLGAAHVMGRVALLEGEMTRPGDSALAQLVLEEKVGVLAGDRVILRDPSATRTIAGAAVVDPFGPPRNRRTPRRLGELRALGRPNDAVLPALLREETGFVDTERFGIARNLQAAEVERLLAEADGTKVGAFGLLADTLATARTDIADTLKAFHEGSPDSLGLPPERLRVTLKKRWPPPVFAALLEQEVAAKHVAIDGALVRLPGHSLRLGAKDEVLWKKIAGDLTRDRFKPPRVRDFAQIYATPEPNVRKLLRQLAKIGRVVEVAPDQFFLRPVVAEMIGIAHCLGNDFTAAQFRDELDNGRKLAILILEFFDRHGITVRRGDLRRTVPQKLGQYGPAPSAEPAGAAPG